MASSSDINLHNVQGDITPGLPKKAELFFFFRITKPADFRARLVKLVPFIATAEHVIEGRKKIKQHKQHFGGLFAAAYLNIAFSSRGLKKLDITENIHDDDFTKGQLDDAKNLGDDTDTWEEGFKGSSVDGVLILAGDSAVSIGFQLDKALKLLGDSAQKVLSVSGHTRPCPDSGREHFGFEDGIAQPMIKGIDKTDLSGQGFIDQGVVFVGRDGDQKKADRPTWALDGSFLAFRYLQQLVPEFNLGVISVAAQINSPPTANAVGLTAARMVGRWPSGAPIQLTPFQDDPAIAADPALNNKFSFDDQSQEACPFAAHIRKMNPRGDSIVSPPAIAAHRVARRGIPYGPEVTAEEAAEKKTIENRGLLFVSYQSALNKGFAFLQKDWANPKGFPPRKPQAPGIDPIIGVDTQNTTITTRVMSGLALGDPAKTFDFENWIRSRGGEYFFSPSISTLKTVIGKQGDLTQGDL